MSIGRDRIIQRDHEQGICQHAENGNLARFVGFLLQRSITKSFALKMISMAHLPALYNNQHDLIHVLPRTFIFSALTVSRMCVAVDHPDSASVSVMWLARHLPSLVTRTRKWTQLGSLAPVTNHSRQMCSRTRLCTVSKPGLSNTGVGAQVDNSIKRHSKHGFLSDSAVLDIDEALIQEASPLL